MADQSKPRYVVVGVTAGQEPVVLRGAARFAEMFGAQLICAYVDTSRYVVEEHPDGTITSMPFDPDLPDVSESIFDDDLEAAIRTVLGDNHPELIFRQLAGEIGRALARLAELMGAELLVVGSRHSGVRAGLKEFFAGSVAAQLAHRQGRPVVIIPQAPISEGKLPWEES